MTQTTTGDLDEDEEEVEDDDTLVHGRKKRKVAFMPSLGKYSLQLLLIILSNVCHRHYAHNLLPGTLAKGKPCFDATLTTTAEVQH